MDEQEFVNWLEEESDGGYIPAATVKEEWPEFYDEYTLTGVTMMLGDDGESLVPIVDYIDCVQYGYPID